MRADVPGHGDANATVAHQHDGRELLCGGIDPDAADQAAVKIPAFESQVCTTVESKK